MSAAEVHQAVLIQRPVFKMNPGQSGELWAPKAEAASPPASPPRPDSKPEFPPAERVEAAEPPRPLTPDSSQPPPQPQPQLVDQPQDLQVANNPLAFADPKAMTEKLVTELQIFMQKSAMQLQARDLQRPEVNKPHQCQQCLKSFSSNHQLVQHIRVHTGEKPYKCSYCERRFKQLSHVQQHTRLHTGERPYRCHLSDCGRAFIQLSNLQQHLRNHDAQVERAKNRPFHCTICGKGFATESSLRTHTNKELSTLPEAAGSLNPAGQFPVPPSYNLLNRRAMLYNGDQQRQEEAELRIDVYQQQAALAMSGPAQQPTCPICHKMLMAGETLIDHMKTAHKDPNAPSKNSIFYHSTKSNNHETRLDPFVGLGDVAAAAAVAAAPGPYMAKRRTANHPCPVCGKHYVNEGSLRKHLACHPETAQFAASPLRMWPCSVCQAVFTHESGLLSHMEAMRMDPKHQFAAQYVLSRAAAERRERESLLAAAAASGLGLGLGGPQCPSPSAGSDSSGGADGGGRLSSAGSDTAQPPVSSASAVAAAANLLLHNNNNNNNTATAKLAELMAARSGGTTPVPNYLQQTAQGYNADELQRAAALLVGQQQAAAAAQSMVSGADSPTAAQAAAVQVAAANLAVAMRMSSANPLQANQQVHSNGQVGNNADMSSAMQLMNAMRASMTSMVMDNGGGGGLQSQNEPAALRMQEAILRSQAAEAALRLAVTQAVVQQADPGRQYPQGGQPPQQNGPQPDLQEALRLQEQRLEQALRLHGDPRSLGFNLPTPANQHINP